MRSVAENLVNATCFLLKLEWQRAGLLHPIPEAEGGTWFDLIQENGLTYFDPIAGNLRS